MVLDFADRMSSIRQGEKPTQLTISVSNYVRRHFSEKICVEDIARELFYEPSVSFSEILARSRNISHGFHSETKNGGGEAPSLLFGQICRSNKFLPRFLIAEPFLKGVQKVLR